MYDKPIKQILVATRGYWDRDETRPAVRENFRKIIECGTLILGAEVYALEDNEKIVPHTCKSKACPSCGHRATKFWQRDQWAALPDIPYAGVVLTMPNVLWPIFQQNRHLLHDLPALGAAVIQQWVKATNGVRVLLMVVPHTFGSHLNFNSHLHILVSAGGLKEAEGRWLAGLHFDRNALMQMWRFAVITYLRGAQKAGVLRTNLPVEDLSKILQTQYERWWSIKIDRFHSKLHFLQYAGRYVRRLPIAQRRFLKITGGEVEFWTKDRRLKRRVITRYSIEGFVAALAEQVPNRYQHSIRYFGLLAPGAKRRTSAALFTFLGQQKRPRPRRLSWRNSLRKYFAVDPLIDSTGKPMRWIRRLSPVTP
ncbi:MAG TPA: transposase [Terriglobales bacterium]|nr:transposase [Terriglobales bacterium]